MSLNYQRLQNLASSNSWSEFLSEYHQGVGGKFDLSSPANLFKAYRENPDKIVDTNKRNRSFIDRGYGPKIGSYIDETISTQIRSKPSSFGEFDSMKKSLSLLFTDEGRIRGFGDIFKQIATTLKDEILIHLSQQSYLLQKINEEAGMTGELSSAFREEIMESSIQATGLGITFQELADSVGSMVAKSGKFKLLSSETIDEMSLASKFTESMGELAGMGEKFERVGIGVKDMSSMIQRMGLQSMTIGLNARQTTTMVHENLQRLNHYGFRNGVDGLNRMAQKSIEFRMNMESVFNMAEKVWEPDKALELVANLQVIGGAFGDLNDPIKLMYMATNNVEGLQDALIGAAKSLVTYNQEQGRFQITGANLRRAREMADQLGMSLDELTNSAIASMERTSAASDIMSRGLIMKDEDKEFLTNLSQMKDGKMVIEVPKSLQESLGKETEIAIEDMTQKQVDLLLSQKEAFEKMTMEDVARRQVTAVENIERDLSFIRAAARVSVGREVADLIESTLGIKQSDIIRESLDLQNSMKKNVDKIDVVAGMIREGLGVETKMKERPVSAPIQSTGIIPQSSEDNSMWRRKGDVVNQVETTKNINITVSPTNGMVDVFGNQLIKDPYFVNTMVANVRDSVSYTSVDNVK